MLPAAGEYAKLGKGSLLLDQYVNGVLSGLIFMDNATAVTIAADVTKAELYSSTQASSPKIAESVTRVGYTLQATVTAFTLDNLKKFLLAEQASRSQASASAQTKTFAGVGVFPGAYLDLGERRITAVSITSDGTNPLVEGTDYIVYAEFGVIGLTKDTSATSGVDVTVTYDRPALTIDVLRIGKIAAPVCKLLYLADDANPDGAAAHDRLEVWKVSIAPEGELGLISDEYGNFQITMSVLSDAANHPVDPFGTLERVRAA